MYLETLEAQLQSYSYSPLFLKIGEQFFKEITLTDLFALQIQYTKKKRETQAHLFSKTQKINLKPVG